MENLVIVRGGGDIATGTIHKLVRSGFRVIVLETGAPSAIRRKAAFCEAMYDGRAEVEGLVCEKAENIMEINEMLGRGVIPVIEDETCRILQEIRPLALVDAILAKKNLGMRKDMAPVTIALGPGFEAGKDADAVIETQRGHDLGRIIFKGTAAANTGVPGIIGGYGSERVIHSPADGIIHNLCRISDRVKKGQTIAVIEGIPVEASIDGILRGIIKEGFPVKKGLKIADIDPRMEEQKNCFTISDKARCIGGSVLEAILYFKAMRNL